MQFDNPTTARLPIPKDIEVLQNELVKPVNEYLKLGKEFSNTPANTDKRHNLKIEMERLEQKIDEVIYKSYELTTEEIRTIEQ